MRKLLAMIILAVRAISYLGSGIRRALVLTGRIAIYAAAAFIRGAGKALALMFITAGRVASYLASSAKRATLRTARATVRSGLFSFRGIINRTLILMVIVAICVAGFLSIRGVMPFMAIYGVSMEPELHAGDLILIEEISPSDVEVGDVIVFTIPQAVREYYNYPQTVAHRVIAVREFEGGVTFRTRGDNTGEDPFTVRPQDIRGQVSTQIPYLGFPLLFFQSQQGLIFIIVALSLLTFYLYSGEISRGRQIVHRSIFAPIIEQNQHNNRALERRMETTEKGISDTQQALSSFTSAIAEYAQHLKSHTSAIQGLSEASQELKKGAIEQNKVLSRLVETMDELSSRHGEKEEEIKPEAEVAFPPGCIKSRRKLTEEEGIFRAG